MKISQSIIKDVLSGCCKHYFRQKHIENKEIEPTTAMQKGLYFESELLGSARGGKFEFPKLKSGGKSKAELDIDLIVSLAKEVFKNSGINVENVQQCIENTDLIGHLDFNSDLIYDVKFTGETYDRWQKSFIYELNHSMKMQANHYQMIEGNRKDFAFLIFSEHGWFRYILYPFNESDQEMHLYNIERTKEEIKSLPEPTILKCSTCNFNNICNFRIKKFEKELVNDLIYL